MDIIIQHHGVKGMHWYVHKNGTSSSSSSKPHAKKSVTKSKKPEVNKKEVPAQKTVHDLSDDELSAKIRRLQLEKQYKELSTPSERTKTSKGKAFVMDVLEKSGKNIATQFTTYAMGKALNKIMNEEVVNPKKGQKDK